MASLYCIKAAIYTIVQCGPWLVWHSFTYVERELIYIVHHLSAEWFCILSCHWVHIVKLIINALCRLCILCCTLRYLMPPHNINVSNAIFAFCIIYLTLVCDVMLCTLCYANAKNCVHRVSLKTTFAVTSLRDLAQLYNFPTFIRWLTIAVCC